MFNFFKPKTYTVRYMSVGVMSNVYHVATHTFTASKREIKKLGCIENVGFFKNYKTMGRHFKKRKLDGVIIPYISRIINITEGAKSDG